MKSDNTQNINVGVDTGKQFLGIFIRPLDIFFSLPTMTVISKKPLKKSNHTSHHATNG
jgi:hypothetical protein